MHASSYREMGRFVAEHLRGQRGLSVLDVGARDVNGTYRPLFGNHHYVGGDIAPGANVDVVFPDPYRWEAGQFDVVISGQCMEHVEDLVAWVREVARSTRPGGMVCLISPWKFREHRWPIDCWRILPDGMRWLFRIAQLSPIQVYANDIDTIGIAKKA